LEKITLIAPLLTTIQTQLELLDQVHPDPDPYQPPQASAAPSWVDLAEEADNRPQTIMRASSNYVPARRDLPAMPPMAMADNDDAGFVAVTAGALRAGDALHDVTSARDRATADAIRVAIAAGAMVAAGAGGAMLAMGGPTWLGVLFVAFGGCVIVALAVLTVASLRHSAPVNTAIPDDDEEEIAPLRQDPPINWHTFADPHGIRLVNFVEKLSTSPYPTRGEAIAAQANGEYSGQLYHLYKSFEQSIGPAQPKPELTP
jgi:hypothetical protein